MSENSLNNTDSRNSAPKTGAECVNPYTAGASKTDQVEEMFDSIAPAYDFMNFAMTFGLHRYWRDKALSTLKKVPHDSILDVATGTGDVAFRLYDTLHPRRIDGIDLSSGMLAVARRKLAGKPQAEQQAITFREADCLHLPYPDGEFDIVTVAYGVRNFERLSAGYAEMLRVLRPGGTLCVIELSTPQGTVTRPLYNFYSRRLIPLAGRLVSGDSRAYTYLPESIAACPQRDAMTALMAEAGFSDPRWRSLTFGAVTIYTAIKPR